MRWMVDKYPEWFIVMIPSVDKAPCAQEEMVAPSNTWEKGQETAGTFGMNEVANGTFVIIYRCQLGEFLSFSIAIFDYQKVFLGLIFPCGICTIGQKKYT
jgi:hypothetical protein